MGKKEMLEKIDQKLNDVDAKLEAVLLLLKENKQLQQTAIEGTHVVVNGIAETNQTLAEMKASKKDYMA